MDVVLDGLRLPTQAMRELVDREVRMYGGDSYGNAKRVGDYHG
jgi:hypothetical protein